MDASISQSALADAKCGSIEQRAKIFAALADPTRLRIVELLVEGGELSGSEIASQINISLALFCHHSRTLVEAGVMQVRKDGQTKFNSLNAAALATCFSSLQPSPDSP